MVLEVEPASPWAAPAAGTAPSPRPPVLPPARPAVDGVGALDDDGSLVVEVLGDEADDEAEEVTFGGRDVRTDHRDVRVGRGGRTAGAARRVALVGLALAALVAGGLTVADQRGGERGLTVQLAGGTATLAGDHATAPTRRWTFEPPAGASVLTAVQDAGAVYVLTQTVGETRALTVDALDAATGMVRWTYDVVAASGTIHVTPDGLILNTQADRAVGATMLALGDGTVRWQLEGFVTQVPGSPDHGIVQQVSGRVAVALNVVDLATGSPRWTPAGTLRTGLGLDVLVDATCDAVTGRAADDGLIRWRYSSAEGTSFCSRSRPQLAVAADRIVVVEGDELVGLDATGRERWRRPLGSSLLAGAFGPYVQLRSRDSADAPTYVDATTGADIGADGAARITGADRDRTVVARQGDRTLVFLDEGDAVVRADRGTAEAAGLPMPGFGAVGLGRTSVYRTSAAGDQLVGYDLATGKARWSVPLDLTDGGEPRVWTADRLVVVGSSSKGLVAFG